MSPDERIFIRQKFDRLHEEIHSVALDVAEIKQWKKDQDEFESNIDSNSRFSWEKMMGIIGAIGMFLAIVVSMS